MRIVDLKTFLELPAGTLFSKYKDLDFGDLKIKDESLHQTGDFFYQEIIEAIDCEGSSDFIDKIFLAAKTGEDLPMNFDCLGRDGCFRADQQFAVWSEADKKGLMSRLACDEAMNEGIK